MGILTWIILGLIAGVIAKLLVPGRASGWNYCHNNNRYRWSAHRRLYRDTPRVGAVHGIDLRSVALAVGRVNYPTDRVQGRNLKSI